MNNALREASFPRQPSANGGQGSRSMARDGREAEAFIRAHSPTACRGVGRPAGHTLHPEACGAMRATPRPDLASLRDRR
eukprot:336442-Chlamydomonas_euryale.AAC.4